jgi:hypothetical protein
MCQIALLRVVAMFFEIVLFAMLMPSLIMPPPNWAMLFDSVHLLRVAGAANPIEMPPPLLTAVFLENAVSVKLL